MKEVFIKSLYETIIQQGKNEYKELLEDTNVENATDKYWIKALQLYDSLIADDKEKLMAIIELVMIDTISSMLGVVDGSSTLSGCKIEPKLFLNNIDTDNDLQDLFLGYVEELEAERGA